MALGDFERSGWLWGGGFKGLGTPWGIWGQRGGVLGDPDPPVPPVFAPHPGSPLQFYVDYVNSGHVTAYGPGLTHGTVNRPAAFTVNTKDAGEGGTAGGHQRDSPAQGVLSTPSGVPSPSQGS